jgi:hypothetical protein
LRLIEFLNRYVDGSGSRCIVIRDIVILGFIKQMQLGNLAPCITNTLCKAKGQAYQIFSRTRIEERYILDNAKRCDVCSKAWTHATVVQCQLCAHATVKIFFYEGVFTEIRISLAFRAITLALRVACTVICIAGEIRAWTALAAIAGTSRRTITEAIARLITTGYINTICAIWTITAKQVVTLITAISR